MRIEHDGIGIEYAVFGVGPPMVLVHGFGSNLRQNWVDTGWTGTLPPLRQVIAIDLRGHGRSDRPGEAAAFSGEAMCGDVIAVLDSLAVQRADVFGYSLGGGIALRLLAMYPERFDRAIIGGIGERNDERLQALDGIRGGTEDSLDLTSALHPVLIVNGANDSAVGDPHPVASRLANATVVTIPGCDHMTVVPDQRLKTVVLDFLKQ